MTTGSPKKIFVFLATGDQGKSTCKYLLEDGGFVVYGLTRNTDSDKAKAIEKMGVKLCQGDMGDVASYEKHLEGMYGVFINGDFWGPYYASGLNAELAAKTEGDRSKAAVDASVKAGVKHIVYSTLGDVDGTIYEGKFAIPHHDSKASVSRYIKEIGAPTTHLFTSHYLNNVTKFGILEKQSDGTWLYKIPAMDNVSIPQFAPEQTGAWVTAAFKDPSKYIGKNIDAISDFSTVAENAAILAKVSGQKVNTMQLTQEQFDSPEFKEKVSLEMWLQYKQFAEGWCPRDIEQSKSIVPDQWDSKAWAEQSPELHKLMGF